VAAEEAVAAAPPAPASISAPDAHILNNMNIIPTMVDELQEYRPREWEFMAVEILYYIKHNNKLYNDLPFKVRMRIRASVRNWMYDAKNLNMKQEASYFLVDNRLW